jgi:hypothetical protein
MPPRAHASRLVAAALAVVALVSSAPAASVLAARLGSSVAPLAPVVAPATVASVGDSGPRVAARAAQSVADSRPDPGPHHAPPAVAARPKPTPAKVAPKPAAKAAPKAAPVRTVKPAPAPAPATTAKISYHGTNHMWMPALGINRSVAYYPCSRTTVPGLAVYRWGCAGANNVYLFAHAYAAFKPLHDAYVGGRLRKGMKVMYADGAGHVRTYAISWWRLTTPDKGGFAFAAQSRPSLTLQTCVGSRSQYRLIVRLVQVG